MHLSRLGSYLLYAFIPAVLIYLLFLLCFVLPFSFLSILFILFFTFIFITLSYQLHHIPKKYLNKARIIFFSLFFLYLIFMIHFLFISSDFARDPTLMMHTDYQSALTQQIENGTNFTPFETINRMLLIFDLDYIDNKVAIINLVGNFVAFMPFSFFALKIFHKKFKNPLRFIFWTSIIIILVEVVQLFTLTGSCDVDDFILNFCGALLAYIVLRIFQAFK